MWKKIIFLPFILVGFSSALLFADDNAKLARYPAPSPDGSKIAFSYQGDIWIVDSAGGRATRLTVHEAYDHHPSWSPDGKNIAFSSDRYGNDDVFIVPANGGEVTRLTYYSEADLVSDWTSDSKEVLFSSRREWSFHEVPLIYTVSIEGGTPRMLMKEYGNEGTLSGDGRMLAFTSHSRTKW